MQAIKFPVPNRSEYIPSPYEPDADGVLDIGYYKGSIIGGRPYVLRQSFFQTRGWMPIVVRIWFCFWNWKISLNLLAGSGCFSVRILRMMLECLCGLLTLLCRMPRVNMQRFCVLYADIDKSVSGEV